jgi:methylenetetrahydrofolate--tRNA-(uracil-5-)-methyltransferase
MAEKISSITGNEYLYFYDAISPIIQGDSIDYRKVFRASRYETEEGDYINCPMTKEEYEHFREEVLNGNEVPIKDFEDKQCFEGCLPIEVMARRGIKTLLFGTMKPVGLTDPKMGRQPYAVVQLRKENKQSTLFNMVGFQTKLTWPEQKRIFKLIPGLENAKFARYGSIHRNTFINSPVLLEKSLRLKSCGNIFFAGQITGAEGYMESAAVGLIAGLNVHYYLSGQNIIPPPKTTALGALIEHITNTDSKNFQPMNINFGLFEPLPKRTPKKERGAQYAKRSISELDEWKDVCKINDGLPIGSSSELS